MFRATLGWLGTYTYFSWECHTFLAIRCVCTQIVHSWSTKVASQCHCHWGIVSLAVCLLCVCVLYNKTALFSSILRRMFYCEVCVVKFVWSYSRMGWNLCASSLNWNALVVLSQGTWVTKVFPHCQVFEWKWNAIKLSSSCLCSTDAYMGDYMHKECIKLPSPATPIKSATKVRIHCWSFFGSIHFYCNSSSSL